MADPDNKHPLNLPGAYYNDDTCIDCDLCREIAPGFVCGVSFREMSIPAALFSVS